MRKYVIFSVFTLLVGCATLTNGPTQKVSITSIPSGAVVTANDVSLGATPVVAKLRRKNEHLVRIEMKGYEPYEVRITRKTGKIFYSNALLLVAAVIPGLVGFVVDASSGAMYELKPKELNATLVRSASVTETAPASPTSEDITVRKKYDLIVLPEPPATKPYVAVMDLNGVGGAETGNIAKTLSDPLRVEFQKTGYYKVCDRTHLDMVMKEIGFQQSGCTSSECAVQVGRVLGVEKMITGSVGKLGNSYIITLQLIDVSTALVEKSVTETAECKESELIYLMGIAAKKLILEK